jgi:hypothetical protein
MRTRYAFVLLLLVAAVAFAQGTASVAPSGGARPGGPNPSLLPGPRFPPAGTIIGTFPTPTTTNPPTYSVGIFEADTDNPNNYVWMVDQVAAGNPAGHNVFAMDFRTRTVATSFAFGTPVPPQCGGRPATANPPGFTGVVHFTDGSLASTDYNGDVAAIDDYLVNYDPVTRSLSNLWVLDSATCPGSCRPNGNTNVPLVNITTALGVAQVNTKPADPAASQNIFVAAFFTPAGVNPNPTISRISVTPGCPGTWNLTSTFIVPGCNQPSGLDWDPGIQSLWVIDRNSTGAGNSIFEVKYNRTTNTPTVAQSWPSPAGLYSIWVAGIHDADNGAGSPGEVWTGASSNNTIIRYDSGHSGPSFMSPTLGGPGSGNATITVTDDPQNGGASYIGAGCFGVPAPGPISIQDDRNIFLNIDNITLITLSIPNAPPLYSGFQGAMTNPAGPSRANPPVATISFNIPALTGTSLGIALVTLGDINSNVVGIAGYSAPFTFTVP